MIPISKIRGTVPMLIAATAIGLPTVLPAAAVAPDFPASMADTAPLILAKGGSGGIKGPFNSAAQGAQTGPRWTTKPKYPLWTGKTPPAAPNLTFTPPGGAKAAPVQPRSRLPQHFNYNAQRPLRFDFKNTTRK